MKKRTCAAILSLLLMFLCGGLVSQAAAASDGPPVFMEVSSVYGEIGKMGVHVPLSVCLYGQATAEFEGEIVVRTLENEAEEGEEIYEYRYPVTVGMTEKQEMKLYVPLGQRSSELHIALRDRSGREIDSRMMVFDVSRDMGRLLVGALTDRIEEISYLDGVSMNYGMVESKLIALDETSFSDDVRGLELLDVLVINHFETDHLSDDQIAALRSWVDQGGTLLIGTGATLYSTLGTAAEELVEISTAEIHYETINLGTEYAENQPGDSDVQLICADFEVPGGNVIQESDGIPLLTMVERGKGQVGIYAYDLGGIREFAETYPVYVQNLYTEVLGEDAIAQYYYYGSYGNEEEYWNAYNLVNIGTSDRLPNLVLYTVVILLYVSVAGPGLYLFLKRLDMSRFYGTFVVLSAIAVSAVVYLMGMGTRFTSQFFTVASILEMHDGTVEETSYINVRTPDSRHVSAELPAGYSLVPLTRSSWYNEQPVIEFSAVEEDGVSMIFGEDGEGTLLYAKKSQAFEPRFFKAETSESGQGGLVAGTLQFMDGTLSGTIINGMTETLHDAAVVLYGQLYLLGDLAPGEVRTLDQEELLVWPVGSSYVAADYILRAGKSDDGQETDPVMKDAAVQNLYSHYLGNRFLDHTKEACLIAVGESGGITATEFMLEQDCDAQILYAATMSMTNEQEDRVYRSGLMNTPEMNSGTGTIYGDGLSMYGMEPVTVEYVLGTDLEVEKLSFLPVAEEFLDPSEYYYMKTFHGGISFYNHRTRMYDEMDPAQVDFAAEELEQYLSPNNHIIVKYTVKDAEYSSVTSLLPHLMVTGRKS